MLPASEEVAKSYGMDFTPHLTASTLNARLQQLAEAGAQSTLGAAGCSPLLA